MSVCTDTKPKIIWQGETTRVVRSAGPYPTVAVECRYLDGMGEPYWLQVHGEPEVDALIAALLSLCPE